MPGRFGRVFVEVALNASLSPCVPGPSSEGVSFVVSPYVVFGSGWSVDWLDAAFDCQARHCGLPAAEFLDGPGQGSEEGLGAAAPGALPDTPCRCARLVVPAGSSPAFRKKPSCATSANGIGVSLMFSRKRPEI